MDLDSMKYAELRNLAKELGLKANMKADKLREAIKKYYDQQNEKKEADAEPVEDAPPVQDSTAQDRSDENTDASCKEAEVTSTTLFVSTRRGKGNAAKRKMSVPESDVQMVPTAAQDDTGVEASTTVNSAKRRRVSPTKAAENTDAELPADGPAASTKQQPEVKVAKGGKIPRYESLHKRNKTTLKPVTPNFKKLHEAHFNKMESIDSYVQRKTKQMETYRNSVKELKMISDKTKQQVEGKTEAVKQSRMSLFSPAPVKKSQAEEKRRNTLLSASKAPPKKPAGKEEVPFRPTILSTRRINVRFSEATKDNEYKTSLLKTPARMSPCVTSSTPQNKAGNALKPNDRTSTFSTTKTPGTFVFTGNTSTSNTPGTQKKTTFDLKASLSRPLSYKPHKGKLKPFGDAKENAAENKSLISNSHQKNYKQHQVQTRDGRRAKQTEDRKQKKASMLGARRGLVMM